MRVIVDETLCEANGFCESLAPKIFELGDSDV
ncbi:MAG: ferredoxin, partial [Mycobacterium sp.]